MIVIIKKELTRFFGDKRLLFTTVLMPGLLIYLMYSLLGETLMKEMQTEDDYIAKAYVVNRPIELAEMLEALPVEWEEWDGKATDRERVLQEIADGEKDGLVIFPEDFYQEMSAYEVGSGVAPNIEIYRNTAESDSNVFYNVVYDFLDAFEQARANKFDVNAGAGSGSLGEYDRAEENSMLGKMLAGMLPMLIMTFIYSGCAAVAPESIAGEKERGTIATLLVTPVKRSALALGKIVSLSMVALLAGISSFLGTILSLPKMMGEEMDFGAATYSVADYALLLVVILSTVLVMVAIISLISAGAKSVKEATTAMSPFMIVVILASLFPMLGMNMNEIAACCIPLFNSVVVMNGIFGFELKISQLIITVLVNLVAAGALTAALTKMFGSEKIMFDK